MITALASKNRHVLLHRGLDDNQLAPMGADSLCCPLVDNFHRNLAAYCPGYVEPVPIE